MSNDVVPQVDLGALSIRGLMAFTPLLSALSADDVAPLTIVQLENLGSPYHINGQYALMVPDLLRRCSSVRLDRIGMMIGWRKGDTASFLAQSAGGQAVALMCFCLANICRHQDIGSVLNDLSDLILPNSLAKSSISQLTVVAGLLSAKLQVIGFGNLLAEQILVIQKAYSHIGKKLPPGFFEFMTRESTVEFYYALSRLSVEESTVLRISGVHAMGYIMMVGLIMFPDNVTITTDSLLIRQGKSPSIFLDINTADSETSPTTIQVEERLNVSPAKPLIVSIIPRKYDHSHVQFHFKWTGHVTDVLRVAFANVGAELSEALVEACCDFLLSVMQASSSKEATAGRNEAPLPLTGLIGMLGSEPTQRCFHTCQTVFGATPRTGHLDIQSAYIHLTREFSSVAGPVCGCTCSGVGACAMSNGFDAVLRSVQASSVRNCLHRTLCRSLVSALNRGYSALFIDAGPHATTTFDIADIREFDMLLPSINEVLKLDSPEQTVELRAWDCAHFHWKMMDLQRPIATRRRVDGLLAISNGTSTIYPTSLNDLRIDIDRGFRYSLDEGQLYVKGRHYDQLVSVPTSPRQKAHKALTGTKNRISPSCSGEHSHVAFTIRESLEALELRTTMIVQGYSIQVDLCQVLSSSMGINDAPECLHSSRTELAPEFHDAVWTTSVAMPTARHNKIAIVQTKDNPTAQLLACGVGQGLVLQRKCCLDCAVEFAAARGLSRIIVAS